MTNIVDGTVPVVVVAQAGVRGAQGTTGIQGAQGLGLQGIQGSEGIQGSQGTNGVQGVQGLQGAQGTTGLQGLTGIQGFDGIQGSIGAQGIQGIIGAQGTEGIQGVQGNLGVQGSIGLQGGNGSQGTTGAGIQILGSYATYEDLVAAHPTGNIGDGYLVGTNLYVWSATSNAWINVGNIAGPQGTQGVQGLIGLQGIIGSQGVQGVQGISIQGATGTQGAIGIQGNLGPQGVQGAQGLQGVQGNLGLQGVQGVQGYQGVTGIVTGATPPAQTDVLWADTTASSSSIQGTQGVQGIQGIGATGAQGTQGIQGVVGGGLYTESATAPTSPIVGDRWYNLTNGREYTYIADANGSQWVDTRTSGFIGQQGIQGIQGPQGVTGIQGNTGPIGQTGATGLNWRGDYNSGSTYVPNDSVYYNGSSWFTNTNVPINQTPQSGSAYWYALALNGATGAQGIAGAQGALGIQGIQGVIGVQGSNGTLIIGTSTTSFALASDNSSATIQTQTGLGFATGQYVAVVNDSTHIQYGLVTSYTSNTGVMTINKVLAVGTGTFASWTINLSGNIGSQGVTGTQGATGAQGTNGLIGSQGVQGVQGNLGIQGTQGVQGVQGVQSTQGIQGLTGIQGIQGPLPAAPLTLTGDTITDTDPLTIQSKNGHGGATFAGIATFTNTGVGATNPNKFIRINPTGSLEIINSSYAASIFNLDDNGNLTSVNNLTLNGSLNGVPVGDSGWIQITSFANSFTAPSGKGIYYRKYNNTVWIRGAVSGGTAATGAFTLPSGYRPATEWVAATQQYGTAGVTFVTIGTDGVTVPATSGAWFNISFPAN